MTKNQLIKALQAIEGDPVVVVYNADDSVYFEAGVVALVELKVLSKSPEKEWIWAGSLRRVSPDDYVSETVLSITQPY